MTHTPDTMLPAILQKSTQKEPRPEGYLNPYELVRRLSIVQAEETVRELERRRSDWEAELLEARGVRQTQIRNSLQTASNGQPHKQHMRLVSISLAPDQLPPAAFNTHLPQPARKHSLPSSNWPQYTTTGSRRASLMNGVVGNLATINENAVIEPTMANLFPEWNENQRRRGSALPRVNNDRGSQSVSTEWQPRRRSSLIPRPESRQQNPFQSDSQPVPRRPLSSSSSQVQKERRRQNWSQSDEVTRPRSRKPSLLCKIERYLKPRQVDASDGDSFDSKASTLRNPWRSSMGDSASSRRPSTLKKIGDHWVVSPPSVDGQPSREKDTHTEEDNSLAGTVGAKRKPSLFSKLRN